LLYNNSILTKAQTLAFNPTPCRLIDDLLFLYFGNWRSPHYLF